MEYLSQAAKGKGDRLNSGDFDVKAGLAIGGPALGLLQGASYDKGNNEVSRSKD